MPDPDPSGVRFFTLTANDVLAIQRLPRHGVVFGQPEIATREEAEAMAASPVAWACRYKGELIACFGIVEHFRGRQGLGWTLLADRLGLAHLRLTRFIQQQIDNCGLRRLELLARGPDLEGVLARHPGLDQGQILALAMEAATPEMRWAQMLGLQPAYVMRQWGADSSTCVVFERLWPVLPLPEVA
jgi:hypothetical protein